ncbi:MAG: fenitrothion hydrolase, partial [Patulibacter sp.]|nr:fenitrothion hydrolase [Patulibacter sp.]
ERIAGPGNLPRPLPYPERAGLLPAALVLLAFGWMELAAPDRDDPAVLAVVALVYGAAMLIGTSVYGLRFLDQADGFAQYFRLAGSLAPLRWHEGRLHVRWPGAGLAEVRPERGLAAVVLVLIGITTFDGLSGGELWNNDGAVGPWLEDIFLGLGLGINAADVVARTLGMLAVVGIVWGFVWVGILGIHRVDPARYAPRELLGLFAPTLVPIAIGYAVAHYCSLLAQGGQSLGFLVSDPRGDGSNWFGTADWGVDYGLLTGNGTWYLQVAALVLGHVAGLVAAHDLALRSFRGPRAAARSQYWMLAVMVGFTSLGLWLLS